MAAAYAAGMTVCRYRGAPVMCGPRGLRGEVDHLFRNNRDGTFTETTAAAGVDRHASAVRLRRRLGRPR